MLCCAAATFILCHLFAQPRQAQFCGNLALNSSMIWHLCRRVLIWQGAGIILSGVKYILWQLHNWTDCLICVCVTWSLAIRMSSAHQSNKNLFEIWTFYCNENVDCFILYYVPYNNKRCNHHWEGMCHHFQGWSHEDIVITQNTMIHISGAILCAFIYIYI
jgi:hypothetical protein